MTAILLFLMLHLFALVSFVFRDKLIAGMQANSKIDDVRALAHWESMIIESKTAHEKMVYLRLADEVRAKLISDVNNEIVQSIYSQPKPPAKAQTGTVTNEIKPAANVVSLADRRKVS